MSLNVAVIVLDTARGRETVPLDPDLTPTLADIAADGAVYPRAFSTAPWTLPAHASLFTGTYPTTHGAHGDSPFLGETLPTVPGLFRDAGYETVGFSNNTWVAAEFGFARGFETFHGPADRPPAMRSYGGLRDRLWDRLPTGLARERLPRLWRMLRRGVGRRTDDGADRTVSRIRRWLDDRDDADPFFLFVNCIEPHIEYRPPRAFAEPHLPDGWEYSEAMALPQDPRAYDAGQFTLSSSEWRVLRGLYRGELAYIDRQVGRIRSSLVDAGVWDDTVFLVVGDHGENIGEHDLFGHQYCLYDTVLHVPLVAHGGPFGSPVDTDRLVQLTDLVPTLLDVADIDRPEVRDGFRGRSLHPDAATSSRNRVYAEYFAPQPGIERMEERFGDLPDRLYDLQRSLRTVRTDRYKYVRGSDGSEALYDLDADPRELTDRSSTRPEVRADLAAQLDEWLAGKSGPANQPARDISAETERRLADLGYR